jgi:hypothetical protein
LRPEPDEKKNIFSFIGIIALAAVIMAGLEGN